MTAEQVTALEAYKMPRPARGQQVLWYRHANTQDTPEIAYVREVGHRTLVVNINGVSLDSVRHISDPKLALNEDQRVSGAWDFPEDDNSRLHERVSQLERDMALVKELLEAPKKK